MSHTSVHLLTTLLTFKKKVLEWKVCCPRKDIFTLVGLLLLFSEYTVTLWISSFSHCLACWVSSTEKKKKKIFVFQALNPQISPAPHLFGHPLPQGRRATGLFPYDSLIGAADAGLGHFGLNGSSSFRKTFHWFWGFSALEPRKYCPPNDFVKL